MDNCISKLTVYFEAPFWVGIYERQCECLYEVCKITFGAEPKDCEVYEFILKHWSPLRFSPSIQSSMCKERITIPKRMQREIHKELLQGVGTKAQQALKLQQEQRIQARKASAKKNREDEAMRRFALKKKKTKSQTQRALNSP